ncbi:hypothetical protein LTR53_006088 [Teratosphaeriaceae sp. CCFEE 6253]|nr:hypothetical protein LTR53_006088 [Teratosphaeriaceae sp. CCFEE 6253]
MKRQPSLVTSGFSQQLINGADWAEEGQERLPSFACVRHAVPCEYPKPAPRHQAIGESPHRPDSPPAAANSPSCTEGSLQDSIPFDHSLELRLMHQWTAHTCKSLARGPEYEFLRDEAPLIALKQPWRPALKDAMFALAAQHTADTTSSEPHWSTIAVAYSAKAADELHQELPTALDDDAQSVYLTSVMLCIDKLQRLAQTADLLPWLRSSVAVRAARERLAESRSTDTVRLTGMLYDSSSLMIEARESYLAEQGRPFTYLLTFASEYETLSSEDQDAYIELLALLALLLKRTNSGALGSMDAFTRLALFPASISARFTDLVVARTPRALVILAHYFALMKVIEKHVFWLKGIAENHIQVIHDQLPSAWKERMSWPMLVMEGNTTTAACQLIMMLVT